MHRELMSAKSNRALPDDIFPYTTPFHAWTYDKKRCESGAAQLGNGILRNCVGGAHLVELRSRVCAQFLHQIHPTQTRKVKTLEFTE